MERCLQLMGPRTSEAFHFSGRFPKVARSFLMKDLAVVEDPGEAV